MNITDVVILLLIVIDAVSLSMVTFIFRWARKAMDNFRTQIMDLLSGENEESVAIIEKLGHVIYQKLYRYFNLSKPDISSMPSGETAQEMLEGFQEKPGGNVADIAKAAQAMGISDPGFLKYLPLLMKFLNRNQGGSESINSSNDSW
jgi:hypothetical protein